MPISPDSVSAEVQLSAETIACLRDEAYAQLCRDSLTREAEAAAHETLRIEATRPPFGLLASKRTREDYETSLRSALHTETELRERLMQVGQLEQWLVARPDHPWVSGGGHLGGHDCPEGNAVRHGHVGGPLGR